MNAEQLLQHFERISEAPDAIPRLRRFILDLAVRGKLLEQDSSDEPAEELLKRIAVEKAQLMKSGKIKCEKPLPPLTESDKAFEVPSGWEWVRLGDLTMLVTSGSRDWAKHYSNDGAIFVRMGNLSKDHYRLRLDHIQRVKAPTDGEGTRTRLEPGDILISITGEVGMLGLIPDGFGEAYINQHTAMVRPVAAMKGLYLAELFRSQFAQAQFNGPQRGIKNSFRLTDVTQFVVPLPPLTEQHRIVAKVDELMAICDQLEAQITVTEQDSRRFIESVLADALAPGIDLSAEALVA
jgi:type I restriction enzyme S subunit